MPKVKIQVYIDEEAERHANRLSKEFGCKKPEIIRRLVNMGIDDALMLEEAGLLSAVVTAGGIMNKLKNHFLYNRKKKITLEELKDSL